MKQQANNQTMILHPARFSIQTRRLMSICFCYLCSIICGHSAKAYVNSQACREIQASMIQHYAAYNRDDLNGFMSLFTPSYINFTIRGYRENYISLLKSVVVTFGRYKISRYHTPYVVNYRINRCSVRGDTATVEAQTKFSTVIFDPKTKRIHHYFQTIDEGTDMWVRLTTGWALQKRVGHFSNDIWSANPIP